MKILVIGGTGVISRAIIREGIRAGHTMIAVNRGTREVAFERPPQTIIADRSQPEAFRQKLEGLTVDVVIDMIAFHAEDAKQTLDLFRGRTGHFIFTSSTAAYQTPLRSYPISENSVSLWDTPEYAYGYGKACMERYLNAAMAQEDAPITVIRPGLTFGEGAANVGVLRQNYNLIDRMRKGKPVLLYGDGTSIMTFTFAPDLAKGFIGCCGNPMAFGKAFHIVSTNACTMQAFYQTLGRIAGREPTFAYLPTCALLAHDRALFEHIWMEKRFNWLFSLDAIRQAVPDYEPQITLEEGLRQLVTEWEAMGMGVDEAKDKLEDQLCSLAASLAPSI